MGKRIKPGERFSAIPVHILESPAWIWLPSYARDAVVSLAAAYTGYNNGGLELSDRRAAEFGLNKQDKNIGLRLACIAKLVERTCKPKRRSGHGKPAKYALTFRPLGDIPSLNIAPTKRPKDSWANFVPPTKKLRSRRQAERLLNGKSSNTSESEFFTQILRGEHHVRPEKADSGNSRDFRDANPGNTRDDRVGNHVQSEKIEVPAIDLCEIRANRRKWELSPSGVKVVRRLRPSAGSTDQY